MISGLILAHAGLLGQLEAGEPFPTIVREMLLGVEGRQLQEVLHLLEDRKWVLHKPIPVQYEDVLLDRELRKRSMRIFLPFHNKRSGYPRCGCS